MDIRDSSGMRTTYDLERKYIKQLLGVQEAVKVNRDDIYKSNTTLEEFTASTLASLENMQDQIDGNITTYFHSGVPTLSNYPADEWNPTEYSNHIGDLYYDSATGYAYRFSLENDTYKWLKLSDSDVTEALAIANAAQDTADSKRRVFVVEPYPPYDVGDIWFNNQELYRCKTSREEGTFQSSDWMIATKYTDDTAANNALAELNAYKTLVQSTYVTNSTFETTTNSISGRVTQTELKVDSKAQVFRSTPTVPYYENDVYITNGNVYVCTNERLEGTYDASDWTIQIDTGNLVTGTEFNQTIDAIDFRVNYIGGRNLTPSTTKWNTNSTDDGGETNMEIVEDGNVPSGYASKFLISPSVNIEGLSIQNGTPTPTNPIDIIPKTGNSSINIASSKNIVDYTAFPFARKVAYSNGNLVGWDNYSGTQFYLPVEENTTYTFSNDLNKQLHYGLVYYDENKTVLSYVNGFTSTFTTPSSCKYIRFAIEANPPAWIQIEKGSTATSYEPYSSKSYNFDLGDIELCSINNYNLFNKDVVELDKRLDQQGRPYNDSGYYYSSFIKVNPNTNYIKSSPTADAYHRVCFYSSDNEANFISKSEANAFTTPNNCSYIRICGKQHELNATQVELGNVLHSYVPYGVPIPVIYDKIYNDGDNWYIEKNIKKVVLDGSETGWVGNSPATGIMRYYRNFDDIYTFTDQVRHINTTMSDRFIPVATNYVGGMFHYQNQLFFMVNSSDIANVDDWKTWLGNNKLTLYYRLATPTTTQITDTNLISQLNSIRGRYFDFNYMLGGDLSKLSSGGTYTLSCYVKADSNSTLTMSKFADGQTVVSKSTDTITNSWQRKYITFRWTDTSKMTMAWETDSTSANNYYISSIKLEAGDTTTAWSPAPEDTLGKIDEIDTTLSDTSTAITDLSNDVDSRLDDQYQTITGMLDDYATTDITNTLDERLSDAESQTSTNASNIADIQTNGVSQVVTTAGYRFDATGLHITRTGAKTSSLYDETGITITDQTSAVASELFFAGFDNNLNESIVRSKNITVDKYLVIGNHLRIENYTETGENPGTGFFYI